MSVRPSSQFQISCTRYVGNSKIKMVRRIVCKTPCQQSFDFPKALKDVKRLDQPDGVAKKLCKQSILRSMPARGCTSRNQLCLIEALSSPEVVFKTFECIANEWQAHLRHFLTRLSRSGLSSFEVRGGISLINLIDREVGRIHIRR
jgi:hypothetical protein